MMLKRGPSTPEKQVYFSNLRDAVDPSRTDLTPWATCRIWKKAGPVPADCNPCQSFGRYSADLRWRSKAKQ